MFDIGGFQLIKGFGGKNKVYSYTTTDSEAEVEAANYFNDVAPHTLEVGDVILVSFDTDGTPGGAVYSVTGKAAGVVTITEMYA